VEGKQAMTPTSSRRRFLEGLSTSAALVAAGRASGVAEAAQSAATPQGQTAGGVLKWGSEDEGYISPNFPWTLAGGINHTQLVKMSHEGPFFRNHALELEPNLVETYEYDEDYKGFTLTVKKGITWSDGHPFTANDVYGTVLLVHPDVTIKGVSSALAFLKGGREYFVLGTTLEPPPGLKLLDEYTIRFELEEPWSNAVWEMLGGQQTLPWHIYQPLFENPETRRALSEYENPIFLEPKMQVGTGPFIYERGEKDRYLRYTKNPNFHGPEPQLDAVEFIKFGSLDATVIALERGDIDVAAIREASYLASVQKMEDVAIYETLDYYLRAFRYNWNKPYLNDVRVYQAIDMAIDRETLCEAVEGGFCVAWRQYGSGTEGFDQNPYNPEKARELLAEANWNPDIDLEIATDYDNDVVVRQLLPGIAGMLGQVGIKAHSRSYQGPALEEVVARGEIDLWYDGSYATAFEPGQFDSPIYADAAGNESEEPGPGRELKTHRQTAFGFHPEWLQKLLQEYRMSPPERREQIRVEVEARLGEEGSSWMTLARYKKFLAVHKNVHGMDNPDTILWQGNVFVNKSMAWTWSKE